MWPSSVVDEEVQRATVSKIRGSQSNLDAHVIDSVGFVFGREGSERFETKYVSDIDGYLFINCEFSSSYESFRYSNMNKRIPPFV